MASLPPEPLVVQRMREFKALLLAREQLQMQEMAKRWIGVEQALDANISALAEQAAAQAAEGKPMTQAQLWRMYQYRSLLGQTTEQFEQYAGYADAEITRKQAELAKMGIEHSEQAIQLSYWQGGRMGVYFDRLPVEAVQTMIGLAGNGAPIGELLKLRMVRDAAGNPLPGVWDRLTQTLVNGTALGKNPRDTARAMRADLTGGLQKALVIARSEQLRVYRMASAEAYRESGVVTGMKRLSAHDARVCAACLADDGKLYGLNEPLSDHPNGRCTGVPVVKNLPQVKWTAGEAWFKAQDESTQQAILGRDYWEAWHDGAFKFNALTTHTRDATWGGGITVTPLAELVK